MKKEIIFRNGDVDEKPEEEQESQVCWPCCPLYDKKKKTVYRLEAFYKTNPGDEKHLTDLVLGVLKPVFETKTFDSCEKAQKERETYLKFLGEHFNVFLMEEEEEC